MNPLIGSSLVQTGGNLISNLFNLGQAKKERESRRELAEYQYTKDLEMWNKANEYNSPAQQMERLKAAGLNPNLVYGNGSVVGNTSPAQTPRYQAYNPEYGRIDVQLPNVLAMLNQYQDLKQKKAQTDNVQEQNMSIKLDNTQKALNNAYLSKTLDPRVATASLGKQMLWQKLGEQEVKTGFSRAMGLNGQNSLMLKYQLDAQKLMQEQRMNDVDYMLKNINYDLEKRGLSRTDSAFLKAISLKQQGYQGIDNILPYIVGYEGFNKLKLGAGFLKLFGK